MPTPGPLTLPGSSLYPGADGAGSAIDTYASVSYAASVEAAAATIAAQVTPSDTADVTYLSRGVFVGGAGSVALVMADGSTVTFQSVPGGTILPVRSSRIQATGTTATAITELT